MIFEKTKIKDAYIVFPNVLKDERGEFFRYFCKNEFEKINHRKEFVQFNQSINKVKGTIRGMHYQKSPHSEIKLIRCIRGSVFDVIVDLRPNSDTYLKWFGEVISAENKKMMYVPEGFAHGFQTLENDSELIYHHTEYYSPSSDAGINYLDTSLKINWPLEPVMVSEKDRNLPFINSILD